MSYKRKILFESSESESSDSAAGDTPIKKRMSFPSSSDEERLPEAEIEDSMESSKKETVTPVRCEIADIPISESKQPESSFIVVNTRPPSAPTQRQRVSCSDEDIKIINIESPDPGRPRPGLVRRQFDSSSCDLQKLLSSQSQLVSSTSVCRLRIETIDAALRVTGLYNEHRNPKEKIQWVVYEYNKTKINKENGWIYLRTPVKKMPRVKIRDRKHFKGEDFQLILYVQEVKKAIPFLADYSVRQGSSVIHAVAFHYRGNEIFAVTTGAARNVVEKYCDFSFPSRVAARIFSEKGAVESRKKRVVGTEVQSKIHTADQEENPFEMLEFCNYTAEIRPTASIFKLSAFQRHLNPNDDQYQDPVRNEGNDSDEDGNPTQQPISSYRTPPSSKRFPYRPVTNQKVFVNLRSVRLLCRLSASDRLSVLDILASIAEGKKTYNIYGQVEVDSSAYLKYLTPVDIGTSRKLNKTLSDLIHDAAFDRSLDNRNLDEMLNFELIHRHFSIFLTGENLRMALMYGTDRVEVENQPAEWEERPPTLKEVVLALRNADLVAFDLGIGTYTRREMFFKRLEKVRLTFSDKTGTIISTEKLLNLIEGLLVSDEGRVVHWHVQGRWSLLGSVYLLTVHNEMLKIIRASRAGAIQYQLPISWPSLEEIENQDIEVNENDEENGGSLSRYNRRFVDAFVDRLKVYRRNIFIPIDNKGLFDFIRIPSKQNSQDSSSSANNTEDKVTLYFIIPTLNYEVIEKGIQISNAMMQIRKAANTAGGRGVAGSENIKDKLRSIWEEVQQHGHDNFKQRFRTFATFQVYLNEASMCIGVGKGVNQDDIRRHVPLEKFAQLPEHVDCQFIQKILQKKAIRDSPIVESLQRVFFEQPQNDKFLALSQELVVKLRNAEYLTSTGGITAKLLAVTKISFFAEESKISVPFRQFLYESIVEDFQAKGFTLLAKLALIRLERTLRDNGCPPMKIIDIAFERSRFIELNKDRQYLQLSNFLLQTS